MSRNLNDWLSSYLKYTENTEPPHMFKVWTGVSAIASALQRKCFLRIGTEETYPNMYIFLIAPSGIGKGRALRAARDLLREVGISIAAERITREALIRELRKSYDDARLGESNKIIGHSSLTVHSSELIVFLGHQNREFLGDLCDIYDCDVKWEFRTKDETKADEIIAPWLNLIGGTTPESIQDSLPPEAIGGGFTSRVICVYDDRNSKLNPMPTLSKEAKEIREDLILDLTDIHQMNGQFKLSEDFVKTWVDWYIKAKSHNPFSNISFAGYFARRPLHVLKLSMIMSASQTSDMIITDKHLRKAIKLLEETEVRMPESFEGVGEARTGKLVSNIMRHIASKDKTTFSELHRMFYASGEKRVLEECVRQIADMGYCKIVWDTGEIVYTP